MTDWAEAGRKSWVTRRANEKHRKGTEAAKRGWETIKKKKAERTAAAKKGWETIRTK